MTKKRWLVTLLVSAFVTTCIHGDDKVAPDLALADYTTGSGFGNCTFVGIDGNKIVLSKKHGQDVKYYSFTMVDVLASGKLIKSCRDHNSYAPSDLLVGDTITVYTTPNELATAIGLKRRLDGVVPPGRKIFDNARPYNEHVNLLNKLDDGGVLPEAEELRFGITFQGLIDSGRTTVASRLYEDGKLKHVQDQVPKVKVNVEDKTLKAPSATAPKDKPPTEKK